MLGVGWGEFGCGGWDEMRRRQEDQHCAALRCTALRCPVLHCDGRATRVWWRGNDVTVPPSPAVPACAKCGSDGRRWLASCGSIPRIGNGDGVVRPTSLFILPGCVWLALLPCCPDGGEIQIPFSCVGIGHGCCQTCIITPDAIEMLVMRCCSLSVGSERHEWNCILRAFAWSSLVPAFDVVDFTSVDQN